MEHSRIQTANFMRGAARRLNPTPKTRNPVKRGLVTEPEQWPWSSFRDYLYGQTGKVQVNDTGVMKMRLRKPAA